MPDARDVSLEWNKMMNIFLDMHTFPKLVKIKAGSGEWKWWARLMF